MENGNSCLLFIVGWVGIIAFIFIIAFMAQLPANLNVIIVVVGIALFVYYIRQRKEKCASCKGTGKGIEYRTNSFCNSCNGTGNLMTETYDYESGRNRKVYEKHYDGEKMKCFRCDGQGYNVIVTNKGGICFVCKGTGNL